MRAAVLYAPKDLRIEPVAAAPLGPGEVEVRIEAGGICVNDAIVHFAVTDVPMGGIKESGIGRRHGAEGIRKFCYQKSVVVDRFGMKSELTWFPNTAAKLKGLRRVMRLLYRSGLRRKLFG